MIKQISECILEYLLPLHVKVIIEHQIKSY